MTPIDALRRQAEARGDRVAFIAGEETWTYGRLATESEQLARALRARGVRPGDRVALHMANVPALAVAYYACFHLGAIAAPLNIRLKTAELRPLVRRLRPALYLGQAALYPLVAAVEPDILGPDARVVVGGAVADGRAQPWTSLLGVAVGPPLPRPPAVDAPAVLLGTSGTTGETKFVVHTPATLSATADAFAHLGLDSAQITIHTLPMAHVSGLSTFLACVRFGVPMALLERFDPDAALDAIETRRCSLMGGLPFMFAALLACQRARPRDITSLRHCLAAGDVCPPGLQRGFHDVFGVPLRSFWGATEAIGALTYGLQPGPVSRVAPGARVRLVDDAGAPVPRGEVGELLIRAPCVASGYWAGPGRIEGAPEDGWYHSGDLMRQGEGDDLWFVARKKELIVRGGSNISPVEVEQVLLAHPAVRDAAVAGVPDAALGQRVAALVQLADDAGDGVLDDIRASVSARLADYKVPERLTVVDALPKNALGKIDRRALPALLAEAEGGKPTV